MIRFGSVCSGIEAASVAWHPLGWRAAWLAEIEPFPCAALAHHYPDVPNLGDMTTIAARVMAGEVEAPDILCGGTPCQAFSVAGKRGSLSDARGNLSLSFVDLADAIDTVRTAAGDDPGIIVWENVPGVLSTPDNAFGCFLGALAGEDDALLPAGGRWADAGVVLGPVRTVCWRVLDAQFFGLAQRRRRVFVVASARDGFDPAAVLLEFDGVRRDSPPRREAREGPAGGAGSSAPERGSWWDGGQVSQTLDAVLSKGQTMPEKNRFPAVLVPEVCPTLRAGGNETGGHRPPGMDADTCTSLVPVAYAIQAGALRTNPNSGPDGVGVQADHAYTLEARAEVQAVAFAQNQRDEVRTMDVAGALAAEPGAKQQTYIAFSAKDHGADAADDLAPTLRAMGHAGSHANGGGQVAVAVALRGREGGATAEVGDDCEHAPRASSGGGDKPHVLTNMAVRRLTPRECERLQGFPDDWTLIPWRKRPAEACPDGPRYKALGNSWAVPCARWIGERIAAALNPNRSTP